MQKELTVHKYGCTKADECCRQYLVVVAEGDLLVFRFFFCPPESRASAAVFASSGASAGLTAGRFAAFTPEALYWISR
jgi:hypothetical protein